LFVQDRFSRSTGKRFQLSDRTEKYHSSSRFDFRVFTQPGSKGDLRLECAPGAGQVEVSDLTGVLGFRKMKAMARQQRSHSIEFKRQVVQEYIAGETLYGLAKRHDLSRQLIRVWVEKYEAGGLDADAQAADLLHEYETKIVALERMVGRQALEIEFLKGALKNAPRPRSATTSVIAGPTASPSQKDAG
jgi:transposase-like protein